MLNLLRFRDKMISRWPRPIQIGRGANAYFQVSQDGCRICGFPSDFKTGRCRNWCLCSQVVSLLLWLRRNIQAVNVSEGRNYEQMQIRILLLLLLFIRAEGLACWHLLHGRLTEKLNVPACRGQAKHILGSDENCSCECIRGDRN